MYLRFFHIVLVVAYFFCFYAEIISAPRYSSLAERSFTPLNNTVPARTRFISAVLPKHIHAYSQFKIENPSLCIWGDNLSFRSVISFNCISSAENFYQITIESPLNKAPPFSS